MRYPCPARLPIHCHCRSIPGPWSSTVRVPFAIRTVTVPSAGPQKPPPEGDSEAAPKRGITIGLARLLEARELWLLVTGERKAETLRAALEGPETPDVPASYLRRHPNWRVMADDAAAALLTI